MILKRLLVPSIILPTILVTVCAVPLAAFEAHVISVTARIENRTDVVDNASLELEVIEASPSAEPAN